MAGVSRALVFFGTDCELQTGHLPLHHRFSGDTTPTHTIPWVARDATLLIHEASMGDEQEEIAKVKAHSTVGQAIQVAREYVFYLDSTLLVMLNDQHDIFHKRTKAKNLLLTHFSARYPKMPPSVVAPPEENTNEREDPTVALAFDLIEMELDQMWKMKLYLPAIEQCFRDSAEEGDEDMHAMVPGSLNV